MALEGCPGGGAVVAGSLQQLQEILHNSEIAASVAELIPSFLFIRNLPGLLAKPLQNNFPGVHIRRDLSPGSHDFQLPVDPGGKSRHGKGGGNAALIFHIHHLVIHHIIVAVVDAPSVGSFLKGFPDAFLRQVRGKHIHRPFRLSRQINLRRIIGTCLAVGASLHAVVRRSFGRVGRVKMLQASETGNPPAGASCQPGNDIQVMAAFLENHGAALAAVSPVTSHKAVSLVPVPHIFNLVDGGHLAHGPLVHQLFQRTVKGCVAEHMADRQHFSGSGCRPFNLQALLWPVAHGLFQQHMITQLEGPDGRLRMHAIHGTHKGGVRHFRT